MGPVACAGMLDGYVLGAVAGAAALNDEVVDDEAAFAIARPLTAAAPTAAPVTSISFEIG